MDFDQAIVAHINWKSKLKNLIDGQEVVDAALLAKDDQCTLGKWIYAEVKEHAGLALFRDLKDKHARFHTVAAAVARNAGSGPKEKALEQLKPLSEYGLASSDCVNALTDFKKFMAARQMG